MQKRFVQFQPAEREKSSKLVRNGKVPADTVKHAYMLLPSDAGKTDGAIAKFLFCSEDTVRRTRVRYLTEGLTAALEDKPHAGREPLLNTQQEAYLIALACSEPPAGQVHWTLELLAQRMVDDEQAVELSPETVRLTLKKQTETVAHRRVVHSRNHARVPGGDGRRAGSLCPIVRKGPSVSVF